MEKRRRGRRGKRGEPSSISFLRPVSTSLASPFVSFEDEEALASVLTTPTLAVLESAAAAEAIELTPEQGVRPFEFEFEKPMAVCLSCTDAHLTFWWLTSNRALFEVQAKGARGSGVVVQTTEHRIEQCRRG